jgi:hypothetical protein
MKHEIPRDVTHVKVDPSVKVIGRSAFERCLSFVEVEFSEGLEVIGHGAFHNCTNLMLINKLPRLSRRLVIMHLGTVQVWIPALSFPRDCK